MFTWYIFSPKIIFPYIDFNCTSFMHFMCIFYKIKIIEMCCINKIFKYIVPIGGQRIRGLVCYFLFSIVQIQSTSYEQNQFAVS